MARSRALRCVVWAALVSGSALNATAAWSDEPPNLQPTLDDAVAADATVAADAPVVPAPAPVFSTMPGVEAIRKVPPKVPNPYVPTGLSDGAFTLLPSLEIGMEAHSNVRQSATNPQGDVGLRLKPSLSFASNWSRHSLSGNVTATWLRYGTATDLSSVTGAANVDFRLDVRRDLQAEFKADTATTQGGLGTSALPGTAISPRTDQTSNFAASLSKDLGGAIVTGKLGVSRSSYGDVALSGGGVQTNTDLNYFEPSLGLRGSLGQKGSRLMPFVEVDYTPRFHDTLVDRNGVQRNSQGGGVALGVTLDDGPIWTGEIAVTGDYRHYAAASLGDAFALGLNGNVTWSPTALDKATLTASFTQGETSTAGVATINNWLAGLEVSHALRDNFQLLAGASLGLSDNSTAPNAGLDRTVSLHGGFEYDFNPDLASRLTLQQTWYKDALGTNSYGDQSLIASLILRR